METRNVRLDGVDEPSGGGENVPSPTVRRRLEDLVSPDFLRSLSESSKGFTFFPDPSLPPHRTGYTILDKREIYYNPLLINGSAELGIEPWSKTDCEGFAFHETGHHVAEVLAFDNLLRDDLERTEIPPGYAGDPALEQRFLLALRSNLQNALVDIWLESFLSRPPNHAVRQSIREFQSGKGEIENYQEMPLTDQFLQFLLRSRYLGDRDWQKRLSPEAAKAYKNCAKKDHSALDVLMDYTPYLQYFAAPAVIKSAIDKKLEVYQKFFLPEYLKLMQAELENRKKERQESKEEKASASSSKSVPLTREEELEIVNEILEELEQAAQQFQTLAPSQEDQKNEHSLVERLLEALSEEDAPQPDQAGQVGHAASDDPETEGYAALRSLSSKLLLNHANLSRRGLAAAMQVREESVQHWERIRENHGEEINFLAASLAPVFLEDRRHRHVYQRRQGEITPGLEYETISALASGQSDPDTKFEIIRSAEFLELEIEFIVDTSGSMEGEPLRESINLAIVVTEAFKEIHATLSAEGLAEEGELPFRIGATKFNVEPIRVSKLTDPLTEQKELTMIDQLSMTGGGTSESAAIREVHREMKLNDPNVIKIMIMLSDGEGDREGVWPIMKSIEEDDQVIFLAVSVGASDENHALIASYARGLKKDREESNVAVIDGRKIKSILPEVIDHIRREVERRVRR